MSKSANLQFTKSYLVDEDIHFANIYLAFLCCFEIEIQSVNFWFSFNQKQLTSAKYLSKMNTLFTPNAAAVAILFFLFINHNTLLLSTMVQFMNEIRIWFLSFGYHTQKQRILDGVCDETIYPQFPLVHTTTLLLQSINQYMPSRAFLLLRVVVRTGNLVWTFNRRL